jgi:glycosyltransferase involved in cell wall biosynthesis
MDVAVIIPLFNGSQWICQTLESVFSQSQPPREVVVVDDGSQDESPDIVKSFSGIILLRNPDKGSHCARNFGVQHTTAPLVAFLDQDDIWHRDHLRLLSTIFEEFTECPAAVAGCSHFYRESKLIFPSPALNPQPFHPWEAFPTNSVATPSAVVMRRSALNLINGWPTQFTGSAVDYYTWLRLSVNQSLMRNPSVTVGYRRHNNSQGMALRLQNTQRLIDTHIKTLEDALSYRLSICPQDALLLKNRLESLSNMSDIVKGAINFNQSLLVNSVIAFEESLAHESTAFIGSMCNLLLWFLYPYLDPQETALATLLEYWPNKAYKTRQCFRERIALSRILPQHLLAHPFDLRWWSLLVEFADIISKKVLK